MTTLENAIELLRQEAEFAENAKGVMTVAPSSLNIVLAFLESLRGKDLALPSPECTSISTAVSVNSGFRLPATILKREVSVSARMPLTVLDGNRKVCSISPGESATFRGCKRFGLFGAPRWKKVRLWP